MTDYTAEVLQVVADREGVDPSELPVPLNDVVDPDALNAVLESGDAHVTFEYYGYRITVDSEAEVDVTPLNDSGGLP